MSLSNALETALLQLLFENAALTNIGDAAGLLPSAGAGNYHVSLHTADPGEAGTMATSECAYTGYARVAVARSGAGWTGTGDTVVNDAAVTFGLCTAGSETITHFCIGSNLDANKFITAALTNPLNVSAGITPSFAPGVLAATAS